MSFSLRLENLAKRNKLVRVTLLLLLLLLKRGDLLLLQKFSVAKKKSKNISKISFGGSLGLPAEVVKRAPFCERRKAANNDTRSHRKWRSWASQLLQLNWLAFGYFKGRPLPAIEICQRSKSLLEC